MYKLNLHCHSLLSDGVLLPSEVAMRYFSCGYHVIAITDHADYSNIDFVIGSILRFSGNWPKKSQIKVLPGVELTHLPPEQFKPLAKYARGKGIRVIVAHGQSPVEPVASGTNQAALESDIDILAHPGYISEEEVKLARKKGIFLEITSRQGHCQANAHVIEQALRLGAKLILNTDSHKPEDIISPDELINFMRSFGLTKGKIGAIYADAQDFLQNKGGK